MAAKRPLPDEEMVLKGVEDKKQKTDATVSPAAPPNPDGEPQPNSSEQDDSPGESREEATGSPYRLPFSVFGYFPGPDERQEIIDELEAGTHVLLFEHSKSNRAQCRAGNCLVNDKIRAPYRFNLSVKVTPQAFWTELEKPNQRFYHVTCFEALGIDIPKYVSLDHGEGFDFHPAIIDWFRNEGKAYDADLYDEYKEELKFFGCKVRSRVAHHRSSCPNPEQCPCFDSLIEPKSSDFVDGQLFQQSLPEVLIRTLGAGDLLPLSQKTSIRLLEELGCHPDAVEKLRRRKERRQQENAKAGGAHGGLEADVEADKTDDGHGVADEQHETEQRLGEGLMVKDKVTDGQKVVTEHAAD